MASERSFQSNGHQTGQPNMSPGIVRTWAELNGVVEAKLLDAVGNQLSNAHLNALCVSDGDGHTFMYVVTRQRQYLIERDLWSPGENQDLAEQASHILAGFRRQFGATVPAAISATITVVQTNEFDVTFVDDRE